MDLIDYRTLADEWADEFVLENQDIVGSDEFERIKMFLKIGFLKGHNVATERNVSTLQELREIVK